MEAIQRSLPTDKKVPTTGPFGRPGFEQGRRISQGAATPLKRCVQELLECWQDNDPIKVMLLDIVSNIDKPVTNGGPANIFCELMNATE